MCPNLQPMQIFNPNIGNVPFLPNFLFVSLLPVPFYQTPPVPEHFSKNLLGFSLNA